MVGVVNHLSQLRGLLENNVRFEVIQVPGKKERYVVVFCPQLVVILSNMVVSDGFGSCIGLDVHSTEDYSLEVTWLYWRQLDPDNFNLGGNNDVHNSRMESLTFRNNCNTSSSMAPAIFKQFWSSQTVPFIAMNILQFLNSFLMGGI